jgi:protein-disulfide isomerase
MFYLNSYQTPVKATIKLLSLLKVKVNTSTVNETLQKHPDWPSLLCISDALNALKIPNAAGKIPWAEIDNLPVPFMAYMYNPEHPLAVVTKVDEHKVEAYQHQFSKPTVFGREAFFEQWKGIYLLAEPGNDGGEVNYTKHKWKQGLVSLLPLSLVLLMLFFTGQSIYTNLQQQSFASSAYAVWAQLFILVAGICVSALLLWYELDKNNPLLKQVCTGIAKGDCGAILTGSQSKVFSWLSWSEVGFIYFSGGLLTLLYANPPSGAMQALGWLHLLALPYTVFSIYYQWRIAKQWCVLCLAVQALLVAGAINFVTAFFPNFNFAFTNQIGFSILLCYAVPILGWFTLKPYLLQLQQAKTTNRQYLRLKFNGEIFETMLKRQKAVTLHDKDLGIQLGKTDAGYTLLKVCNPYCGPCSKAHPKIEKVLHALPNLRAQIIFTAPNNPESMAYHPVNHLLAIQEKATEETQVKQAMDDWYLSSKKDYEAFATKYPMNGELTKQGNKIEKMDRWCKAADIRATPTFFITAPGNQSQAEITLYQLPDAYSIEDLQYFLQA